MSDAEELGVDLERLVLWPEQSRMARAALKWSIEDAAAAADVSRWTVLRFGRYRRDVKPELAFAFRPVATIRACGHSAYLRRPDAGAVVRPRSPGGNKACPTQPSGCLSRSSHRLPDALDKGRGVLPAAFNPKIQHGFGGMSN